MRPPSQEEIGGKVLLATVPFFSPSNSVNLPKRLVKCLGFLAYHRAPGGLYFSLAHVGGYHRMPEEPLFPFFSIKIPQA